MQKGEENVKESKIEVIRVNPAFTSVIGALRCAPVIGRRALGFKVKKIFQKTI